MSRPKRPQHPYAEIFSADPLLLQEKSQEKYSGLLLHHLLLARSMSSCVPVPVDPYLADVEGESVGSDAVQKAAPDRDLVDAYLNSRRNRTPLAEESLHALRGLTMAFDARFTANRRYHSASDGGKEVARLTSHDEALALDGGEKASSVSNRLRIAVVGFRVGVSKLPGTGHFGEQLCPLERPPRCELNPLREGVMEFPIARTRLLGGSQDWERSVLAAIEQALARQSHIIMLPEFALPPNPEQAPGAIEARIMDLSAACESDHFIFAGSRHEGSENRGFIVAKYAGRRGKSLWHSKRASARGLGENILGPRDNNMPLYFVNTMAGGKLVQLSVMVAICYDAFDPSTFLNIILQCRTFSHEFMSIILVPSFNTSPDFVELLRDLSCISRSAVVYVNGLHGDAKMFVFGFAVHDLAVGGSSLLEMADMQLEEFSARYEEMQKVLSVSATGRGSRKKDAKDSAQNEALSAIRREVELKKSMGDIEKRREALLNLRSAVAVWERTGALKNMLTVESASNGSLEGIDEGVFSPDDIIYYNLDLGFLSALKVFRERYFFDDSYLPAPFSVVAIEDAISQLHRKHYG